MKPVGDLGIPRLAGICTGEEAQRIGYPVDENVRRLLRYHWVEKRLMEAAHAHLAATPEWEVKEGLALHQWLDAEHATALRGRIEEMRHPAPRLDLAPDAALDAFLEEVLHAEDTVELLTGLYGVARRSLAAAYREHLAATNPLVDHPTRRVLRFALLEEEEALAWGEAALEAVIGHDPDARARSRAWEEHLRAYLQAADGVAGGAPQREPAGAARAALELPEPRAKRPFAPSFHPHRDHRFRGRYNFNFPPHVVYNDPRVPADERNLALLCKRLLEMDVPEMMASFLWERRDQPWEFYRAYARQLWDEARHAMMGEVALERRGVDWTSIPLNIGFSLRLNLHATPLERQAMLWAIEQTLMPRKTGKQYEYRTAVEAGDALSAHFHDYDWADEVLHARIGRRWLRHAGLSPGQARELGQEVHERTWAALESYRDRDEQADWWDEFVRRVLGRPSALRPEELKELRIIAE